MRPKPNSKTGRRILCDKCCTTFRGAGMTRVMRKIVFHFCPRCWADRGSCEAYMVRIAYGEMGAAKENVA